MTSTAPLLLDPLDVTLQTFMRLDDGDRLDRAGTPLPDYLGDTVRPWVTWLAERFGRDGCPLHDPLALATLLDPSLVGTRRACAGIELRGSLTRGRPVAWDPSDDELLAAGLALPRVRPVDIADSVDNERFVDLLVDRLTG